MHENNLIKKFIEISNKGWIKGVNNNFGSCGLTFEREIGKTQDADFFPDYNGIELKCCTRFSNYPLYLFTISFDGPGLNETDRIAQLFGYSDKDFKDKKVLFAKLSGKHAITQRNGYRMKLEINDSEEKIYLNVNSINGQLLDDKSYLTFQSLYNHLTVKLNKMALIHASKKVFDNNYYYRFYRIDIYELRSFDNFISMLKEGKINVTLISRLNKSGDKIGEYRNKNLVFE